MRSSITKADLYVIMNSNQDKTPDKPTLRDLLKNAEIKQEQLAQATGLSTSAISDWVTGRKMMRFDSAVKTAQFLGVSLKQLASAVGLDTDHIPDDCTIIQTKIPHPLPGEGTEVN